MLLGGHTDSWDVGQVRSHSSDLVTKQMSVCLMSTLYLCAMGYVCHQPNNAEPLDCAPFQLLSEILCRVRWMTGVAFFRHGSRSVESLPW